MSVVSEIKKGSKKIKAAQLDRITDISGKYFAEYNSSTGECKNPVAEPITNIVITGNSTKVNADPDIPNDYVAIEYIESTGKQWIKIDDGKYDCSLTVKFMFTEIGVSSYVDTIAFTNNMRDGKQYPSIFYHKETNKIRSNLIGGDISDPQINTIYELTSYDTVDYNNGYELFECKGVWGANQYSKARIYYAKTHDTNNVLTRDIVPVIRKSDNKPGMYDKVSKQFFVNQGTGEFITGPELPGKILEADTLTKRGKNLLNILDQEYTQNGVKITVKNGLITLNGTSTGRAWIILNSTVNLNKGHYYFNRHKNNCLLRINENTVRYIEQSSKFTINEDNITIAAQILQEENVTYTNKQYIMSVTESSSEQIYEPYQQPEVIDLQPIHGIGEVKDKIEVVRDVEYNQLVINGNLVEDKNWYNSNSSHKINNFILESIATSQHGGAAQWFDASKYREHKMLCILEGMIESNDNGAYFGICLNDNFSQSVLPLPNKANEWQLLYAFGTINKNAYNPTSTPLVKIQDPRSSNWTKRCARNIRVIDLTKLFGVGNEPTTLEEFYSTPIGKLIQKGIYLPFSESNNRISKVTRYRVTNKVDLGTFDYNLVTLNGNPGFVAKSIPPNMLRDDTNITDAGYKYDGSLSKDHTFNTYRGSGGPWFRNDAFTRDQQGCDDLKASLSGKYLLYPLLTPYYEDITDTPQGQVLLNLTPYQPYTTEFEVNNDGTIEFGYWRQIDPLPDTYTRVKALVSDGNQKITVSDIVGKNLFNPNGKREVIAYSSIKFIETDEQYTATLFDKGNGSDISGIYLSISDGPVYMGHADAFSPFIANGEIKAMQKNNQVGLNQRYLSVYPPNEDSWKKIFNRFNITIVKGPNSSPEFIPYISSMQNNSLEMSEPKKTLFQNKDNRVLSVDGYALKYNQICVNGNFKDNTNWGTGGSITVANNIITVESASDYVFCSNTIKPAAISGRKYLLLSEVYSTITTGGAGSYVDGYGSSAVLSSTKINEWQLLHTFVTATTNGEFRLIPARIGLNDGNTNTVKCRKFMFIDLTDMFGAGNEPTTLDEFYATPQGKLYHGYVEYGYHILGAGEYKSNQLVRNGKDITTGWEAWNSSNISVSYSNGAVIATSLKNEEGYGYSFGIQNKVGIKVVKGNKYLLVVDCKTEREDTTMYFDDVGNRHNWSVGKNWTRHEYIWINTNLNDGYMVILIKPRYALRLGETYQVREAYSVNLTELGLDHLTLDELKAQRPDLFVYKPYHETETRYGLIFNDGSVYPMEKPLYGIADVKDKQSTNGTRNEKYGMADLWELNWEYYGFAFDHHLFSIQWFGKNDNVTGRTYLLNCICNKLKQIPYADRYDINNLEFYITPITETSPNGVIYVAYNSNDIQEFKQFLLGTKMIYELATPTTKQTTPASIEMDTTIVNEQYTAYFTPVEQWIAKYYSGTHAVLNYIPAVRNSDLKPGMYEVATGEFKTNEGTGEFTYINDWTVNEPVTLEVDENKVEE